MSQQRFLKADERVALRRRLAAELDFTAGVTPATPSFHPLLTLGQQLGNAQVARMLAQRQDTPTSNTTTPASNYVSDPIQLRLKLLELRGVTRVNPLTLRVPPAAQQLPKWLDPENPEPLKKFWKLKFKLDIDEDSELAQAIEREEKLEVVLGAGAEASETPLGLKLAEEAVNMLPATKPGEVVKQLLHLDSLMLYFNPTKGVYGVGVKFKF